MEAAVKERLNAPLVYPEGRYWVYRAHVVGDCLRAVVAARLGYEPRPSDVLIQAAEDGREREPVILERMTGDGWRLWVRQQPVEFTDEADYPVKIRGHADAIRERHGELRLLEAKTMSDDRLKRFERRGFDDPEFRRYAYQLSFYMHGAGRIYLGSPMPADFVVEERETRRLVPFPVETPPIPMEAIVERVRRVEAIAREGKLPSCDLTNFFCVFQYLCEHARESPNLLGRATQEAIERLAERYLAAQETEKQARAVKEECRAALLALRKTVDPGARRFDTPSIQVGFYASKSQSFDFAKARMQLAPETWQAIQPFIRETEYVRVVPRRKGDRDAQTA